MAYICVPPNPSWAKSVLYVINCEFSLIIYIYICIKHQDIFYVIDDDINLGKENLIMDDDLIEFWLKSKTNKNVLIIENLLFQ